jgi:two-component system cell cycle response regulator DivK
MPNGNRPPDKGIEEALTAEDREVAQLVEEVREARHRLADLIRRIRTHRAANNHTTETTRAGLEVPPVTPFIHTRAPRPTRPVLVVEDHDDTREMVQEFLQLNGYAVVAARNGAEALALLGRAAPCVILLDLTMPVMDGPTFVRGLRHLPDPEVANTPIVLLTAVHDVTALQQEIGAQAVIRWPASFAAIAETVHQHCGSPDNDAR